MAQVVGHRPLTSEVLLQFQAILCVICGGQNDTGTGFSLSILIFPCQYHSTNVLYLFITDAIQSW